MLILLHLIIVCSTHIPRITLYSYDHVDIITSYYSLFNSYSSYKLSIVMILLILLHLIIVCSTHIHRITLYSYDLVDIITSYYSLFNSYSSYNSL